jgi:hypothetical protein
MFRSKLLKKSKSVWTSLKMGRTACMDMVLELRMETSSLTVEGAVKPSASACSTAVQVQDQERDLEKRRRQRFEQGGDSFARRR